MKETVRNLEEQGVQATKLRSTLRFLVNNAKRRPHLDHRQRLLGDLNSFLLTAEKCQELYIRAPQPQVGCARLTRLDRKLYTFEVEAAGQSPDWWSQDAPVAVIDVGNHIWMQTGDLRATSNSNLPAAQATEEHDLTPPQRPRIGTMLRVTPCASNVVESPLTSRRDFATLRASYPCVSSSDQAVAL